jgi:hypothetical protein
MANQRLTSGSSPGYPEELEQNRFFNSFNNRTWNQILDSIYVSNHNPNLFSLELGPEVLKEPANAGFLLLMTSAYV